MSNEYPHDKKWRQWLDKSVFDNLTGVRGKLFISKRNNDLIMDEGGILHKEEVVLNGGCTDVYFGSAESFGIIYQIDEQGNISLRGVS